MATGIRSYGPGKFDTIIDSYAFDVASEFGVDNEESYPEGGGWYGYMAIDAPTEKLVRKIAEKNDDQLTEEEVDLLETSAAVIFFERSDGIVEADWFDNEKKAQKAWAAIEAEFEEEEDGDEDEDEDGDGEGEGDEDEDFDLESEMEDALVIGDARSGYSVSFSGKHIGDFDDFDEALEAGVQQMHDSNYFPNIFYVNERGNTDLLTVKYELQNGKAVNIESTTVRSWV